MNILVALILCSIQCNPLEGMQLAPYLPSLSSVSERAKFLQEAAAKGDVAFIGFIHKSDPLAWTDGDAWRTVHDTTALHAAAASRDELTVRALLALGADPNTRDSYGRVPLHVTARSDGTLAATRELLDAGAHVDVADSQGVTPLMEAVRNNAPRTATTLLRAGANRTLARNGGFSVVIQALQIPRFSDNDILPYILGFFHLGEQYSSYPCDGQTMGKENSVSSRYLGSSSINSTDSLFRTRLHKMESCDTISKSYSHLVNARDLFHRTPLHMAVLRGSNECVKKLLDMGADKEAVDWLKRTPLQIAKLCNIRKIVDLLNSDAQA